MKIHSDTARGQEQDYSIIYEIDVRNNLEIIFVFNTPVQFDTLHAFPMIHYLQKNNFMLLISIIIRHKIILHFDNINQNASIFRMNAV